MLRLPVRAAPGPFLSLPPLTATLILGLALPTASRADNLDRELLKQAPRVLTQLAQRGYRNVAVLPFRVQKGSRKARLDTAPLSVTMPTRLENAPTLDNDDNERKAIGIIRAAGPAASQARVSAGFSTPDRRRNLFKFRSYPLAWGNHKVPADAFITGLISNTDDRSTTTVQLEFITRDAPEKLQRWPVIKEFTVPTDRGVLRDLGYNFALVNA